LYIIDGACIQDREINCRPVATEQFRNGVLISLRFEIEGLSVGTGQEDALWDNLPLQQRAAEGVCGPEEN
jgi:hypothetical protein